MKTAALIRRHNYAAFRRRAFIRSNARILPNAAQGRYFLEKLLDAALAAATTVGVVVALMFSFIVFA